MSIEEKAKAYDKALEQAKKELAVSSPNSDSARQIFRFFPELKESEDERIRKGLIDALTVSKSVGELKFRLPELTRREAIAYLEKQKEQKPAEWCPTKEQMVALSWAANGMLDSDSPSAGDIKASLRTLYNDLQSKSIMPAEWSEEDKSFYDSIICEVIKEGMHPTPEQAKWFKSLPERFNLQPKQEWSDEDEENFKWFDKLFRAESIVICGKDIPQDKYLWFKSLRPKSHWKPNNK